MLIRDVATRRYPFNITTYDAVLGHPEQVIPQVLQGLGVPDLDIDSAVKSVSQKLRTQTKATESADEHVHAEIFDELYEHVHNRVDLTPSFLEKLNNTHVKLIPEIEAAQKSVFQLRAQKLRKRRKATDPDLVETLIHPPDLRDDD
jgi:hypothetical protein